MCLNPATNLLMRDFCKNDLILQKYPAIDIWRGPKRAFGIYSFQKILNSLLTEVPII